MIKPEGTTDLIPKYFTELHKEVLEILGEEKCFAINNIMDSHDSFSFRPIIIYIKRKRTKELLLEGNLTTTQIAYEVELHVETVRMIQRKINSSKKLPNN